MPARRESDPDIRRGHTLVYHLHTHLVFTPIHQRKVFTDEILRRRDAIMIKACDTFGAVLAEFNGEHDQDYIDNQKQPD